MKKSILVMALLIFMTVLPGCSLFQTKEEFYEKEQPTPIVTFANQEINPDVTASPTPESVVDVGISSEHDITTPAPQTTITTPTTHPTATPTVAPDLTPDPALTPTPENEDTTEEDSWDLGGFSEEDPWELGGF